MVNAFKSSMLLLALFFSFSAFAESADCNEAIERIYGDYTLENIERYRGGLTSRDEALNRLNMKISVKKNDFLFWDGVVYQDPIYEIKEHDALSEEGHVPDSSELYGNFYGYGLEREKIITMSVHSQVESVPSYIFEVVESELWLFLDGWFYRFMKTSPNNIDLSFSHSTDSILDNDIRG